MKSRVFLAFSLAASILVTTSWAQSFFELGGTVLDESGIPLSGVTLTLVHEATGTVRTTTTNDAGHYAFPAMPPGLYSLEVRLEGYATSRYAGLRYFADTKPIFNVTLRLREVQESMTFTGEAPLINVSQSQVGLSVEERQLRELPLKRRDYLELVAVAGAAHELDESVPGEPEFGAPLQTINGANAHYTTYRLDGFQNTREEHGVVLADLDLDSVDQFRVITGPFSAEYGGSVAGIVSAATRSGGNDFHGSLFAFVRPGSWDAADPLTGADTALDRQELGFTLSGPLRREKTQFFSSFSYRNQDEDAVVTAPYLDGRFEGVFELPADERQFLFKLSHLFNPRHQLTAKAVVSDRSDLEGVGGFDVFANGLDTVNDDVAFSGTLVSELGSALSELRLGFVSERFRARSGPPPLGAVLIHPTLGNIGNEIRSQRADENHWEVSETLSFARGDHGLKAGFSFVHIESETELARYLDGVFHFAPGEPERPILYRQSFRDRESDSRDERGEEHFQVFFQDDWQLTPYVTLNLGLRWQKETSLPDDDNLAPRLGFHWDASRDGRTSVRGGYGIFHGFVFSIIDSLERLFGPETQRIVTLSPEDPRFPPSFETLGPDAAFVPADLYVEAPVYSEAHRSAPRAQHLTFGVEREVVPTLSIAADVSHVRGSDLILPRDLNAPSFFDYAEGGRRSAAAADATRPFGAPGEPISAGVLAELPDGFPFGRYRDLYLLASSGSSRFWGVKLNVTKRYAAELMLQAVYQWSRTTNDGDDFRVTRSLPLNPANPDLEWGRSATDIPHSLVVNGVWDAPWGLRFTGLLRARSGRPVDPRIDEDLDGDRKLRERAFRDGVIFERNSFRAPAFASVDLSISKGFGLGEGRRLEASFDVFNLTNRLNPRQFLQTFGRSASAPLESFLRIVQAAPPRQFQLSARFSF